MRALVVDDSNAARETAKVALEDAMEELGLDFPIDVANGGVEALKILAQQTITVLIVDLHMPDIHGLEVLSFWKERGGEGLALIATTRLSDLDRDKAMAVGALASLEKPITSEALVEFLRSEVVGRGA